jgi:hypothetical protein
VKYAPHTFFARSTFVLAECCGVAPLGTAFRPNCCSAPCSCYHNPFVAAGDELHGDLAVPLKFRPVLRPFETRVPWTFRGNVARIEYATVARTGGKHLEKHRTPQSGRECGT